MNVIRRISQLPFGAAAFASLTLAFCLAFALWTLPSTAFAKAFEPNPTGANGDGSGANASDSTVAPDVDSAVTAVDGFIFDEYGIFTAEQSEALEEQAQQLADQYGMGVYVLVTDYMDGYADPTSSQRTNYATTFYKMHDLGLGDGNDGIMLAIAIDSRDYVTIAYGQGSYSFSDRGIEVMEDAVTSCLSDDQWYEAAGEFYRQIDSQLAYYERHGKAEEPLDAFDWIIRLFIILVIPAIIALLVLLKERSAMKTAVERNEAHEYLDPSSVMVTEASDSFITTTVVATPRAESTSNSGGGSWGGGGGGGFSSSGGGKF